MSTQQRPALELSLKLRAALLAVLVVLILAAFAPVLHNDFVDWDDDFNFLNNPDFRGLGWPQFCWTWRATLGGVYQPLAWLLLEVQSSCWDLSPTGYHAVSLGLHVLVALLLCWVIVAVLRRCRPELAVRHPQTLWLAAVLASALFALHPLRTEVVAWVSCQPYLPCILFCEVAVLAYLRAHDPGAQRGRWLFVAWICTAAALLCKALAAPLPVLLLLLDGYPLRRWQQDGRFRWRACWPTLTEKLPFLGLTLATVVVGMLVREAIVPLGEDGLLWRLGFAAYSTCFYLWKTVYPVELAYLYGLPGGADWATLVFAGCALLLVGVTLLCWRYRPGVLAAWLAYLIVLAPNAGLVRSGLTLTADRYSYLPGLVGAVLLAGLLWPLLASERWRRLPAVGTVAVLFVGLGWLSWQQSLTWRDSATLHTHAACGGGWHSGVAQADHGKALFCAKRLQEAVPVLERAVALEPLHRDARKLLGVSLLELGRAAAAVAHLRAAAADHPTDHESALYFGVALTKVGRPEEAERWFHEALRRDPAFPLSHHYLGLLLIQQKRWEEAVAHLQVAVQHRPQFADSLYLLGFAYLQQGHSRRAAGCVAEAIVHQPDHADALHLLGFLQTHLDQCAEGVQHLRRAVQLRPDFAEARLNLGWALGQMRRLEEAEAEFRKVLLLRADAEAHQGLGMVLTQRGRFQDAVVELERALQIAPQNEKARQQLEALRARSERTE